MSRFIAAILLVAVLAVGGGIIATTAYQAGVNTAVTTTGTGGTVVAPVVVPGYGYGWHPFGWGFGFFGLLATLFFVFIVFALIRAIFWRGGPGGRGGPGRRGWGGPDGSGHSPWAYRAHDTFDDWHKRAHADGPNGGAGGAGGPAEPPSPTGVA